MSWGGNLNGQPSSYVPAGIEGTTAGEENYPNPGGYWEYPNWGGPAIWHPTPAFAGGTPINTSPNEGTFNPEYGNSMPGGVGSERQQGLDRYANDSGGGGDGGQGWLGRLFDWLK
jgi:hypothetical protein